jgi:hypothetical protein
MRKLIAPFVALLLIITLLGGMFLATSPLPVQAQNTDCYRAQGGDLWVCDDGGAMEFQAGSTLSIDTFLTTVPQDALTLTMNGYLTPTGTLQLITAAGAVSVSGANIADGDEGDLLILLNSGSNTVTITETTGLISAGNIALGASDSATLVYRGTSWYQIGASNN